MSFIKYIYISLVLLFLSCDGTNSDNLLKRSTLATQWEFRQEGMNQWLRAEVPGVVHTDLLNHGIIPDPWVGTNENEVQWIENENWEYQCNFDIPADQFVREQIDLVFEGLDTYAEVKLNDSTILEANNMFREWRVQVKELVKEKSNKLSIRFLSPIIINKPKLKALGYELPAGSETVPNKVSPFTRKAPYHFGWDWGPRLVTSGVWRPVYVESWNRARIENVRIIQRELSDGLARLEAHVTVESTRSQDVLIEVMDQQIIANVSVGENRLIIPFEIVNPERWWPNGWGSPKRYRIPVSLQQGGMLIDSTSTFIGLRTIELIRESDSIGEGFYFKINGEPIFARGANYIPQSHFLPSVSADEYEQLIADVKDANMNMLRVWGGGIYEKDLFYDLCDKYGIMVWQDFMFAGSMYPGDAAFIKNVAHEVEDNVRRLRNHPSVIHWNGNNELEVAWNNWGWQKQYGYTEEDSTQIWEDYLTLFHELIPSILARLDDRPYTTTSPLSNWGTLENFNRGSMHYWGVWHGGDDFEDYQNNVGRFMSEYGFQSFPSMETIDFFADSSEWTLESVVMKHHQKSYVGNAMISRQAEKYFDKPKDFADFVVKSQQTQAKAMQIAIDAHRLNKGHCWGSLYWQLNDCWPGPSWSSIDVFGRKKILHNQLEMLFAPVALIPIFSNGEIKINLINDELEDFNGMMQLTFYADDRQVSEFRLPVFCESNGKNEVFSDLLSNVSTNEIVNSLRIILFHNDIQIFNREVELTR